VNCNSDLMTHWCELPVELANEHYLPHGNQGGLEADLEDLFNPGHTYKYAAPRAGTAQWRSGAALSAMGADECATGHVRRRQIFHRSKNQPVKWVIWSLGPQPNSKKTLMTYSPMTSDSWYRQTGGGGVIVRFADRYGTQFTSP